MHRWKEFFTAGHILSSSSRWQEAMIRALKTKVPKVSVHLHLEVDWSSAKVVHTVVKVCSVFLRMRKYSKHMEQPWGTTPVKLSCAHSAYFIWNKVTLYWLISCFCGCDGQGVWGSRPLTSKRCAQSHSPPVLEVQVNNMMFSIPVWLGQVH